MTGMDYDDRDRMTLLAKGGGGLGRRIQDTGYNIVEKTGAPLPPVPGLSA